MKIIELRCPSCGAHLDVDSERHHATCPYCSATFPIDDEIQHVQYDNAEQAGYEFEKGRLRAQAEFASQASNQQEQERPKKSKVWLWILGFLTFPIWFALLFLTFPILLTILMVKKKDLNKTVRIGTVVAAWIVWLVIMLPSRVGWGGEAHKSAIVPEDVSEREAAFVIDRIEGIDHIQTPKAVTKYHDPNDGLKYENGYVAAVFFSYDLVERDFKDTDVIDRGTDGGGCIEVFRNDEDARKRDEYLGSGFLTDALSGSHCACGRYVIRTSRHLERHEQKKLENSIREALVSGGID